MKKYVKVFYENKPCKRCNQEFKPKTSHQLFCSKSCYKIWGKTHKGHSHGAGRGQPYRIFLKSLCERCGFIPEHLCQLDVDHIDEDHNNNNPQNLQTLCANCHRLKSIQHRNKKGPN